MNMATIMWSMVFGSIGMGYVVFGRQQRNGIALVAGLLLCVFPFFVDDTILMIVLGVALMALPWFIRI